MTTQRRAKKLCLKHKSIHIYIFQNSIGRYYDLIFMYVSKCIR